MRLGQRGDVVGVDLTRQPGRLGMRHVSQRPPQPQAPPCRRQRRADARRQPRRRAAGAVGLPGATRLEGGARPGGGRVQPLELAVQVLDRLAVGEARRLRRTHRVDRAAELDQDVHRSSASGPHTGPSGCTPTVDRNDADTVPEQTFDIKELCASTALTGPSVAHTRFEAEC